MNLPTIELLATPFSIRRPLNLRKQQKTFWSKGDCWRRHAIQKCIKPVMRYCRNCQIVKLLTATWLIWTWTRVEKSPSALLRRLTASRCNIPNLSWAMALWAQRRERAIWVSFILSCRSRRNMVWTSEKVVKASQRSRQTFASSRWRMRIARLSRLAHQHWLTFTVASRQLNWSQSTETVQEIGCSG